MSEMVTTVVRRLGSEVTHVVTCPTFILTKMRFLAATYTGTAVPLAARCTAQLSGPKVVMASGTKVRCKTCRMLTGIEVQP